MYLNLETLSQISGKENSLQDWRKYLIIQKMFAGKHYSKTFVGNHIHKMFQLGCEILPFQKITVL